MVYPSQNGGSAAHDEAVQKALEDLWETLGRICSSASSLSCRAFWRRWSGTRTPCERILASDQVKEFVKKEFRDQYTRLDPVFLLEQIRLKQNAFWRHAHCHAPARGQVLRPGQENLDNPMRSSRPYSGDGALEPAYAVIPPDDENRTYRRTKRKNRCRVPHTWRTCPDPFEGVWPDVEAALEQSG